MLFHPEKRAVKMIEAAELIYLCYYESEDEECGPSLMKCVELLRREGLRSFWFSANSKGDIEELLHVPVVYAFFLYGPTSAVDLTGRLEQLERFENGERCKVHFAAKECWLRTGVRRKRIPI